MKKLLVALLCFAVLGVGCSSRASNFRKAYNTLSVVQTGYNSAQPILVSETADLSFEDRKKIEGINQRIHDGILSGWRTLIAYKEKTATADQVEATFHALLEGLRDFSNTIDSETFKRTVNAVIIVVEIYLNQNPQDAKLLQPTVQELKLMAAN